MKGIQKLFIVFGILTALLSSFSGEQQIVHYQIDDNKTSFSSDDRFHSSAFLQPQVISVLSANFQSGDYPVARFTETFLPAIPNFKVLHPASHFICQNPGYFKKVAILLYPFHFFW